MPGKVALGEGSSLIAPSAISPRQRAFPMQHECSAEGAQAHLARWIKIKETRKGARHKEKEEIRRAPLRLHLGLALQLAPS